jgi:hypothetical protein
MNLMSLDSSWNALQLCFWFRDDRTKRSAANSWKRAAGVSALFQPNDEFRGFGTERFIVSSRSQKTFDKELNGLSNGIK